VLGKDMRESTTMRALRQRGCCVWEALGPRRGPYIETGMVRKGA
jgi:hypothetical protein